MTLPYGSILAATVVQFVFGAIWYTPVFGKLWGKIHGFEAHSKAEQEKMMKAMLPMLGVQFVMTIVTSVVLSLFLQVSDMSPYVLAGLFWLGFVVPTQVSAVIFGGTPGQWVLHKIAIMAFGALGCFELAALVLTVLK